MKLSIATWLLSKKSCPNTNKVPLFSDPPKKLLQANRELSARF